MSKKKTFTEKVRGMTIKQIVGVMIRGLENPRTDAIDMSTYGSYIKRGDSFYIAEGKEGTAKKSFCVGCAATNAVLLIANIEMTPSQKRKLGVNDASGLLPDEEYDFCNRFERAINALRDCSFVRYNTIAEAHGFAQIPNEKFTNLPVLESGTYKRDLPEWKRWYKTL